MNAPASALRARAWQYAAWLAPLVVAVSVFTFSEKVLTEMIGGAIALVVLVLLINRPAVALISLIIFMPLQLVGFGLLLGLHVPASVLRPLGGIPELLALAVLLAGLRSLRDSGGRLDRIDIAVLAYVAAVTLYLIVPHLFSSFATTQWSPRILAWRSDAGYPLVFFAARHAPITARQKEIFLRVVLCIGALVAFLALYQRSASGPWWPSWLSTSDWHRTAGATSS